jgi:hypothetical protein
MGRKILQTDIDSFAILKAYLNQLHTCCPFGNKTTFTDLHAELH